MRLVIFWTVMLVLLFAAQQAAKADDYSFKMGAGLIDGSPSGAIKTFSLRQETSLLGPAHTALEGGFWTDTGRVQERRGSAFGLGQVGIKPGSERGLYGSAFVGAGLISNTDSQLGGHFQFAESFGIGVRDESSFIQIEYRHLSSAGIYKPNKGRDFLIFSIGVSL